MIQVSSWDKTIGGKRYSLSYERDGTKNVIAVNGEHIEVKEHLPSVFLGFDEPFTFDGIEARLLVRVKSPRPTSLGFEFFPDIVIDGTLLNRKKKYQKRSNLLWMLAVTVVFTALSVWLSDWVFLAYVVAISALSFRFKPSSLTAFSYAGILCVAVFICSMLLLFLQF